MVTPEERITRLEAMQEVNAHQMAEVLSRLDQLLQVVEAARQEAREANETARQEAREANETARREAREMVESARKDARNLFIAGLAIASAWGAGLIGLGIAILQRLPG